MVIMNYSMLHNYFVSISHCDENYIMLMYPWETSLKYLLPVVGSTSLVQYHIVIYVKKARAFRSSNCGTLEGNFAIFMLVNLVYSIFFLSTGVFALQSK
jgi:hypothetical protein